MIREKIVNILINQTFINKLDSISTDLKVYYNFNVECTQQLPKDANDVVMSDEEVEELFAIRHRIKNLSRKLSNKIG